jgi:hypothetical protein
MDATRCTACRRIDVRVATMQWQPDIPVSLCQSCVTKWGAGDGESLEEFKSLIWENAAIDVGEPPGSGALRRQREPIVRAMRILKTMKDMRVDDTVAKSVAADELCLFCDCVVMGRLVLRGDVISKNQKFAFVVCHDCCSAVGMADTDKERNALLTGFRNTLLQKSILAYHKSHGHA